MTFWGFSSLFPNDFLSTDNSPNFPLFIRFLNEAQIKVTSGQLSAELGHPFLGFYK